MGGRSVGTLDLVQVRLCRAALVLPGITEPGWDVSRDLGICTLSCVSFGLCEMAEMSVLLAAEFF